MRATRECRRKHWLTWSTKTLGDGTQLVVCRTCGAEPGPDQLERIPRLAGGTTAEKPGGAP